MNAQFLSADFEECQPGGVPFRPGVEYLGRYPDSLSELNHTLVLTKKSEQAFP